MKKYTVIGGVNGVGKSALSGVLAKTDTELGIIVDADKLTAAKEGNKLKSGKKAVRIISDCLNKGVNFTQETTLSGKKTLRTIIEAKEKDYYIRLFYIGVSTAEESLSRIKNRVLKGGHDIPEEDVKRRYNSRFEDLKKILPYCNEVQLYDNENGFIFVGEYRNGKLFTVGNAFPRWITDLEKYLRKDP